MRQFHDDWLLPTLETLLGAEELAALKLQAPESLWDEVERSGLTTNGELLAALAVRFRMAIANLSEVSAAARSLVPESLARKVTQAHPA